VWPSFINVQPAGAGVVPALKFSSANCALAEAARPIAATNVSNSFFIVLLLDYYVKIIKRIMN